MLWTSCILWGIRIVSTGFDSVWLVGSSIISHTCLENIDEFLTTNGTKQQTSERVWLSTPVPSKTSFVAFCICHSTIRFFPFKMSAGIKVDIQHWQHYEWLQLTCQLAVNNCHCSLECRFNGWTFGSMYPTELMSDFFFHCRKFEVIRGP